MTYWYLLGYSGVFVIVMLLAFRYSLHSSMHETVRLGVIFTGVVGLIGAILCALGFISSNINRADCLEQGAKTRTTVEYRLLTGCHIRIGNRYIPYDQWVRISGSNAP